MPKKKTHKAVSERVMVKGGGKGSKSGKKRKVTLMTRAAGKNHFNTRDTGKKTRNKRSDNTVSSSDARNIARLIFS
jgi:ribosomal protein L35